MPRGPSGHRSRSAGVIMANLSSGSRHAFWGEGVLHGLLNKIPTVDASSDSHV